MFCGGGWRGYAREGGEAVGEGRLPAFPGCLSLPLEQKTFSSIAVGRWS